MVRRYLPIKNGVPILNCLVLTVVDESVFSAPKFREVLFLCCFFKNRGHLKHTLYR